MPGNSIYQYLQGIVVTVTDTAATPNVTKTLTDILDITIELKRNEPMEWTITLDNSDRKYTNTNSDSPFYGYLVPRDNFRWTISVTENTETKTWSYLTNLSYRVANTPEGYQVIISGTDYSWMLLKCNRTLASWISTTATQYMARYIVGSICTTYGVTSNLSFSDYLVKKLNFQGEIPLDIIKNLLAIRWADWFMSGNQLVAYDVTPKVSPTAADFVINEFETITSLGYEIARWSTATRVVVRNRAETSKIAFEEEGNSTVEHSIDVNAAFPDGAINVSATWNAVYGDIMQIYCWSGTGKTGSSALYPGTPSPSAKSISFYFQPTAGIDPALLDQIYYHLIVKGDQPIGSEESQTDFFAKYKNTTLESVLGEYRPAPEQVINSLIPSLSVAQDYATRYLQECARKYEVIQATMGLYLTMMPGHTIEVTEYGSGLSSNRFYVESVSLNIMNGTTSIVASKIRNDTIIAYTTDSYP